MRTYQYIHIVIILLFLCESENVASMSTEEKSELRKKVLEMFHHGYRSYMDYAYPADELMPLSCKGRYRGTEPSRGDVDDTLGNFSLTLIDTLDTLVVLGEIDEFEKAVRLVINGVNFDSDIVVSVFETNIRVLGGLLGGHVMARYLKSRKKGMDWYHDELLEKAKDIGYRLLPAFNTTTGMPYPRVNLRYGVKHHLSRTGNEKDTCTACAGTMILEFSALSRLTGDPIFEEKAHKAMEYLWKSRHRASDLVGTVINIHNGDWVRRDSGVGAGIDSYYEYVLKAYILLGDETYLDRFNKHYAAIRKYVTQGPMLVDVHMHKPFTNSRNFMDALLAFWPGLLTLIGDLKPAVQTHEMLYQVIQRHSFLPEAFTTDFRIHWAQHPLRPEFLESTYFLYKATGDSHYLQVGKEVLENLNNLARVKCGFAAIKDVTTGAHEDQMDSYVLAETFKYLYLLFSEPEDLIINIDDFVFTTEAHLLPLSLSIHNNTSNGTKMPEIDSFYDENEERLYEHTCPNANHVFESNYVKTFRDPLKNMVDSSCPASQARCQVPVLRMPFVKDTRTSSCRPNNHKRLKASEFVAGNKDQLDELARMGIRVITMRDGRVQLLHTAADAASSQDAEDGMQFMQEMIELSKHQVTDAQHEPHVIQLLGPPFIGHVLHAGPAQFGYDLKKNDGVKGKLTTADPLPACSSLANDDLIRGRIVIVERGDCMFINKARAIQAAGALAGIVIDNHEGTSSSTQSLFAMSGDGKDDVTIPVLFLFYEEGQKLLEALHDNEELEVFLGFRAKKPAEVLENFVFEKASKIEIQNKKADESEKADSSDTLDEPLDHLYKVNAESGLEQDEGEHKGKQSSSQESFIQVSAGPGGRRMIELHLDQARIEKGPLEVLLEELISQLNEYTNFQSLENTVEYIAALRIMLEAISQNDYNLIDSATLGILQHLHNNLEPKQTLVISDGLQDSVAEASSLKQKLTKEMESMLDEYIVAELKKVVDEASMFSRDDNMEPSSNQPQSNWVATKVFNGHLMSYANEEELSNYGLSQPKHNGNKNFKPFLPPKVKQAPGWLSLGRGQIMLAKDGNIYADLTDSYWQLVGSDSPRGDALDGYDEQGEGHSGGSDSGHSDNKHITPSSSDADSQIGTGSPCRADIQHHADSASSSDTPLGVDIKRGAGSQDGINVKIVPSHSTANDQNSPTAGEGKDKQHDHQRSERQLGNQKDINRESTESDLKRDRTNTRTSNEHRDEL